MSFARSDLASSEMRRTLLCLFLLLGSCQARRLKAADTRDASPADLAECSAKLIRFESLDKQDLSASVGQDPFFLPALSSIAAPGTKCGDAAQNISTSCEKFNHWKTFQEVSRRMRKKFKVISDSGISFRNIHQGGLGNCYLHSGLASVAVNHPEVLDNMFVDRDLWEENIFTTKWLLHGKTQTLAVDNMLPASTYAAYFAQPTDGAFWPVILEKTWAKVFGNYKAIESGSAQEVIKAMTRAPSEFAIMKRDHDEESLWNVLLDCVENKYAMTVGTANPPGTAEDREGNPAEYKLAIGHAYSVLDAYELPPYGKVVKMFNPWNRNNYVGSVPNSEAINGRKSGVFTMALSEFHDAFYDFYINYVKADYKVASTEMSLGSLNSLKVAVTKPGKFWVSLVWASSRMVEPCDPLTPKITLSASSESERGKLASRALKRPAVGHNDFAIEIENAEGGIYNIVAGADFEENVDWMDHVSLTVYAPGDPEILESSEHAADVALAMLGPSNNGQACIVTSVADLGTFVADFSRTTSAGLPTYWSVDETHFIYYVGSDQWNYVSQKYFPQVRKGEVWKSKKFTLADLTCSCQDSVNGVQGFGEPLPCNQATNRNWLYSNVMCHDVEYSLLVQRYCPRTCNFCDTITTTTTTAASTTTTTQTTTTTPPQDDQSALAPASSGDTKTTTTFVTTVTTTTTTTTAKKERPTLPLPMEPAGRRRCGHISGATDRPGLTWGQGSCMCASQSEVLGSGCKSGWLFAPGRRYFSKTTLQDMSYDELASCKCEWNSEKPKSQWQDQWQDVLNRLS